MHARLWFGKGAIFLCQRVRSSIKRKGLSIFRVQEKYKLSQNSAQGREKTGDSGQWAAKEGNPTYRHQCCMNIKGKDLQNGRFATD
jgi:hypothetical protein